VSADGGLTPDRQSSHLFRCASCEAVYVARTKDTCGTEVTRIHSTPSGGSDDEAVDGR
jgi:predicted RNA-binding protein with PUA domain